MEDVEANIVRCPDPVAAERMIQGEDLLFALASLSPSPLKTPSPQSFHCLLGIACGFPPAVDEVRNRGESCGGEVTCVVRGCPRGLGAPVFDKLEAELAKALMSLPATKVRSRIPEAPRKVHHHLDLPNSGPDPKSSGSADCSYCCL